MKCSEVLANELLLHFKVNNCLPCEKTQEDILPFVEDAKADIAFYVRRDELPSYFESKVKELAKIRVLKSFAEGDRLKNKTYTEGSVSKSETYLTAADYMQQEAAVFSSLNQNRGCRIVTE